MKKQIAMILATLALAGNAMADGVVGGWEIYEGNAKKLTGAMEFTKDKNGGYLGDLQYGKASESCVAKLHGNKLNVRCKMNEQLSNYDPDNFMLTIVSSNRMEGQLISNSTHDVVFIKQ